MYVRKIVASSYHFIENSEFWLPPLPLSLWPPFDSQGLENDVGMGNRSGYNEILKNNT